MAFGISPDQTAVTPGHLVGWMGAENDKQRIAQEARIAAARIAAQILAEQIQARSRSESEGAANYRAEMGRNTALEEIAAAREGRTSAQEAGERRWSAELGERQKEFGVEAALKGRRQTYEEGELPRAQALAEYRNKLPMTEFERSTVADRERARAIEEKRAATAENIGQMRYGGEQETQGEQVRNRKAYSSVANKLSKGEINPADENAAEAIRNEIMYYGADPDNPFFQPLYQQFEQGKARANQPNALQRWWRRRTGGGAGTAEGFLQKYAPEQ